MMTPNPTPTMPMSQARLRAKLVAHRVPH
jgi:hypothetical protein